MTEQNGEAAEATQAAARRLELERLVRAVQAGDRPEDQFRRLYEQLWPSMRRFFLRKGMSHEESLDLTQEVFLGIYRGLKGFRHESQVLTWVYQIANTTYLKRMRSKSSAKRSGHEVSFDVVDESGSLPVLEETQLGEVLGDERKVAMRQAIGELPDQMRKCLALRVYQELSYREIAVVMRLKIDTVKAHLFQAKRKLKERLGEASLDDLGSW